MKKCEMLATEIAAVEIPTGAPSPVHVLLGAARRSAEKGFADAAAVRLDRARQIIADPSAVPSDDAARQAREAAEDEFGIGQVAYLNRGGLRLEVTIDGDPRISAETNRVFITYTWVNQKGRTCYALAYADDLESPETGLAIAPR